MPTSRDKRSATASAVRGKVVATVGDLLLVRTQHLPNQSPRPKETAHALLTSAGRALRRPGLPRASVFNGSPGVFAYFVDPLNPTQLIRESEDGTRTIGHFVRDRFIPLV